MGLVEEEIQEYDEVVEHTIVEAHPEVYARMLKFGWGEKRNVMIVFGKWQDVLPQLGSYDVTILQQEDTLGSFTTCPLEEDTQFTTNCMMTMYGFGDPMFRRHVEGVNVFEGHGRISYLLPVLVSDPTGHQNDLPGAVSVEELARYSDLKELNEKIYMFQAVSAYVGLMEVIARSKHTYMLRLRAGAAGTI